MTKLLHFTLGPVQGFVASARRTRDLWAGSFLLSYLSGHAMKSVLDAGGSINFPEISNDKLLAAIQNPEGSHNHPDIGSLPNRFKATVPESFDVNKCKEDIGKAWKHIAEKVWYKYVFSAANLGNKTQIIWDRQIDNFWDIAWVVGDDPGDKSDNTWLDQRKNWRTYQPEAEGGDHCTLMGDWQELSGHIRSIDKKSQEEFWDEIRENLGNSLDLGDSERLCAIALIKRLFPLISKEAIGWELDVRSWPSTSYMAAVPWLRELQAKSDSKLRQDYVELVKANIKDRSRGEYNTQLSCINREPFTQLDGQLYFKYAIESDKEREYTQDKPAAKQALQNYLLKFNDAVGYAPSPFYALLFMDGDSLGKLLQNEEGSVISRALASFTDGVDEVVRRHCGKTVYAGGDDVLALVPLDEVLGAAQQLRNHYLKSFSKHNLAGKSTISAAIVFSHYNQSFRTVLNEAHHQLDNIAKEGNGRDSLAISVSTSRGRAIEWVSSWDDNTATRGITEILEDLSKTFSSDYSSGFFYNIGERFELLIDENRQLIEGLEPLPLLTAEFQKNREHKVDLKVAEERVGKLLRVCRIRKNGQEDLASLNVEGALLVRFLASKGKGLSE